MPRDGRTAVWLALLVLAFNLVLLNHVGLFDVDEAIFAEATREMVQTRDFVTPTYNYQVRWDKPPLTYWLMAGPEAAFGANSFGARFTSAVAGALLVLLLVLFGRTVFGAEAGMWAGLVLATSLHGFMLAHWAATDMVLTLLMAAGWMALFLAGERRSPKWLLAAAAALALATLTKGPVAVVLPMGTWLLWLLWRRQLGDVLLRTRCWWAALLYLAVLAPWCIAIYQRHGLEFYQAFLGHHNLDRLTRAQEGHHAPVWFFLAVIAGGLLPWTGFAAVGLLDAARLRKTDSREARAAVYLLLWAAAVVVLFSASQTKLPNYIAPAYPALCLLAGRVAAQATAGARRRWAWLAAPAMLALAALGLALLTAHTWLPQMAWLQREVGRVVIGAGPAGAGFVILVAVLSSLPLLASGSRLPTVLAVIGALTCLTIWRGVVPVVYRYEEGTLRIMALEAERHNPGGELATLNMHFPSVAFTVRHGLTTYRFDRDDPRGRAALAARFADPRPIFLIARLSRVGSLLDASPGYVWGKREGWLLVSNLRPPADYGLPPSPWRERQLRRRR